MPLQLTLAFPERSCVGRGGISIFKGGHVESRGGPAGSKNVKPPEAQAVLPRVMTDTEHGLLPAVVSACTLEAAMMTSVH